MSQSTAQMSMSQAAHKPNCIQQANKLARLLFTCFYICINMFLLVIGNTIIEILSFNILTFQAHRRSYKETANLSVAHCSVPNTVSYLSPVSLR